MQCETLIAGKFVEDSIAIINAAKNSIDVCVFDWRWYPDDPGAPCQRFNQSIVQAARRGVKIRALVNGQRVQQHLSSIGAEVKRHISKHLLHLKMMIIDEKTVITGSHNYTQSAFTSNYELSVILSDGIDVTPFKEFFDNLWLNQ